MPSTVIRKFHYDASSQQLIIEFLSGRRYAYFEVPAAVYTGMRHAQSRGSYFNACVRDRYFHERLEDQA
jgi:hypothetical protein